jgi:plastocyanin
MTAAALLLAAALSAGPVDWVKTDGRHVVYGAGTRLSLAVSRPQFRVRFERELAGEVTDALLAGRRLVLVLDGRRLAMMDLEFPRGELVHVELDPAPRGELRLALDGRYLAVAEQDVGTRLFEMAMLHHAPDLVDNLTQVDLLPPREIPRTDRATAGRAIYIAGGEDGLLFERDETQGAMLHPVAVLNDFFMPQEIAIAVGDTVRWTNSSGLHNVRSCVPNINGCETTSNETFGNGAPAPPIWIYSYTFTEQGSNPYICTAHAPFMVGLVEAFTPTPPRVPAGMTVGKLDPAGASLSLAWDATGCPGAVDHQILYGTPSMLPSTPGGLYTLAGAACAVGNATPYSWAAPAPPSGEFVWWIVVTTDGATREGSWRTDSAGNERDGPGGLTGASGECGIGTKLLTNGCGE